jgi:hypothetical protein
MYCFQAGIEVNSIKCEATDAEQEQEKSAVALTFPEIKAEEEVSFISLYPLLFRFSNILGFQNILLCIIHMSVHNTYISTCFRQVPEPQEPSVFYLSFPVSCFHTTCLVCPSQ